MQKDRSAVQAVHLWVRFAARSGNVLHRDVNGVSFVKRNAKFWDDAAHLITLTVYNEPVSGDSPRSKSEER